MTTLQALGLSYHAGVLCILDQTLLPEKEEWVVVRNPEHMIQLIQRLAVRGAPLIGIAAALALANFAKSSVDVCQIQNAAKALRAARPTAVNLMWAIDRMLATPHLDGENLLQAALQMAHEDKMMCEAMAEHAFALIEDGDQILTVCNSGGLATVGVGTALGALISAHQRGKRIHVYACETRPLLQGARLTAWELAKAGVPFTLLCDSAAATAMQQKKISSCFVGADRIAANGDFANKIGTYALALAARFHKIPFYAVAPESTCDPECPSGASIPIEERADHEVLGVKGSFGEVQWAPPGASVFNPAFDVTPFSLVSGVILNTGIRYSST